MHNIIKSLKTELTQLSFYLDYSDSDIQERIERLENALKYLENRGN